MQLAIIIYVHVHVERQEICYQYMCRVDRSLGQKIEEDPLCVKFLTKYPVAPP